MKRIFQILMLAAMLGMGSVGLCQQPATEPGSAAPDSELRRGVFNTTFSESSPFSAVEAQSQRYHVKVDAIQKYTLAEHQFEIYVPEDDPQAAMSYGLLVWISAGDNGSPPRSWHAMLDAHHLIGIGADGSGNEKGLAVRIGLALDGVHNLKKLYHVDESRIYAAGVSGGGKIAGMLATIYPETFDGALTIVGVTYFRNIPVSGKTSTMWPPSFNPPGNLIVDRARLNSRFILMTGSEDMNRDAIRDTYNEGFLKDGFRHVQYVEIPNQGHGMPADLKWIDEALTSLDIPPAKPAADPPTKPSATRPAEAGQAVSNPEAAASQLFLMAENYENNGLHTKAAERLDAILKDYPSTKTAAKARLLLSRIKSNQR